MEIVDRKGSCNQVADHLSRLENEAHQAALFAEIKDYFPDEKLYQIEEQAMLVNSKVNLQSFRSWYADYANYVVSGILQNLSYQQKKKSLDDVKEYLWEAPHLYKFCSDQIIKKCVPEEEQGAILKACHNSEYGDHHNGKKTAFKVL